MNQPVELEQAFVKNLAIPPRPQVVSMLFEEMSRDEPDLRRVAKVISADVGIAGAMLKTVNSSAFGLSRKATSVAQAIDLLGMRNVSGIATGLAIRHSISGAANAALDRFWDSAEKTAIISAHLARVLREVPADEAYTLGLFHDCGIPLLLRQFPAYKETLARANRSAERSFTQTEEAEVGTHHAAVGYFLARSWHLSEPLSMAILRHHDIEAFADASVPGAVRSFIGIIHLAEHIQHLMMRSTVDVEWVKFEAVVLRHFSLGEEDFINLVDGAQESLQAE